MTDIAQAIQSLNKKGGNSHEFVVRGEPTNEAEYNSNVDFVSGSDANGNAIFSNTKPYTWSEVNAEKTLLQIEYDALEYQRKRKAEYPTIEECVHAILDNDLENLQALRTAVKEKYPK